VVKSPRQMPTRLAGTRIVVVEDHGDSRDVLVEMLRLYGATVLGASSAGEALALAPDADIIVTDFALPSDQDGVWLLEQVNHQTRPIPVIVLSGYAASQNARLDSAPFARKLLKPIDPEALCREIAEALHPRVAA
jgi:two-component system, NarL family, sensor histidine kinase EvgS